MIIERRKNAIQFLEKAILSCVDDPGIIYGITLDALYRHKEDTSYLTEFISFLLSNEASLSSNLLEGVTKSLVEYQLYNKIQSGILDNIVAILEKRIFDNLRDDDIWINNSFILFKNDFSKKRLNQLIDFLIAPYEIPEFHRSAYINVLATYYSVALSTDLTFSKHIYSQINIIVKEKSEPAYDKKFRSDLLLKFIKLKDQFEVSNQRYNMFPIMFFATFIVGINVFLILLLLDKYILKYRSHFLVVFLIVGFYALIEYLLFCFSLVPNYRETKTYLNLIKVKKYAYALLWAVFIASLARFIIEYFFKQFLP